MTREGTPKALSRWGELEVLQNEYREFKTFLYDVIEDLLGFHCTAQQLDIAKYLQYGPLYSMVQAQRGQAKTTIVSAYAVWRLIHDPTTRILILSGGSDVASEISNWVIQIIMNMPELACLCPDNSAGDRSSVNAFDVHHSLRGAEKSPSVACKGIRGQLQGRRADVIIADDIETQSNSDTELKRSQIRELTLDFTSICSTGKIIYLGTPQSVDSTYNSLSERGYDIRIWPGRFPTEEEEEHYGGCLAPFVTERMRRNPELRTGGGPSGDRGRPTDPELLGEEVLTRKEIDQGRSYFQLQHMLDTRLMDKDRYPLHLSRLVFTPVQSERMPLRIDYSPAVGKVVQWPLGHPMKQTPIYYSSSASEEFGAFTGTYMYVDPSGGGRNGDELAWAVTKFLAGYVYLVGIGGIPGGVHTDNLKILTALAVKHKPHRIGVEKNFGNGALCQVWRPQLIKEHSCMIEEPWESGQKELRIIDILEPLIGSGRLIVDDDLVQSDWVQCQQYPTEVRSTYSLFYQIAKITRERGALLHDDRVDALAGACRPWATLLAVDANKATESARRAEYRRMTENPLGLPRYATHPHTRGFGMNRPNTMNKYYKRRTHV